MRAQEVVEYGVERELGEEVEGVPGCGGLGADKAWAESVEEDLECAA